MILTRSKHLSLVTKTELRRHTLKHKSQWRGDDDKRRETTTDDETTQAMQTRLQPPKPQL